MNDKRTPEARAFKRWRREKRIKRQVYRVCHQILEEPQSDRAVQLETLAAFGDEMVNLRGLQKHLERRLFWATLLAGPRAIARALFQWLRFSI